MTTIFICIPWFSPAFRAGGPVQSIANLVNEFNEEIQYRIFCGNTDLNNVSLQNIETGKWVDYNVHTKVWYAEPEKRSDTLTTLIDSIKPDVLFVIGIYSWHFNIVPLLFCKVKHKILSVRGMLHPGALSQKPLKKKIYLAVLRMLGIKKKISFHATDEEEKKFIEQTFGTGLTVFIAGNFPRKFTGAAVSKKAPGRLDLVSIALIGPVKNHLLVLESLEICKDNIEYHICGPVKDMEYWQQCLREIKKLPANIKVHYHGDVEPQKVKEYLAKADVFIMPSKSENFGHAFYEAFTAGRPVITSMNTPWLGLEKKMAGMNVNTEVNAIKNAIDFFAAMPQTVFDQWSNGAIKFAEESLDISLLKKQYSKMFFGNL
ncbi:MAG: glycosyltransferase [Ferruginibacter sp.]